jgi:hypothetical protein
MADVLLPGRARALLRRPRALRMRLTCALLRVRHRRELRGQLLLQHPALGRPLGLSRRLYARRHLPWMLPVRPSLPRVLRVRLPLVRVLPVLRPPLLQR